MSSFSTYLRSASAVWFDNKSSRELLNARFLRVFSRRRNCHLKNSYFIIPNLFNQTIRSFLRFTAWSVSECRPNLTCDGGVSTNLTFSKNESRNSWFDSWLDKSLSDNSSSCRFKFMSSIVSHSCAFSSLTHFVILSVLWRSLLNRARSKLISFTVFLSS